MLKDLPLFAWPNHASQQPHHLNLLGSFCIAVTRGARSNFRIRGYPIHAHGWNRNGQSNLWVDTTSILETIWKQDVHKRLCSLLSWSGFLSDYNSILTTKERQSLVGGDYKVARQKWLSETLPITCQVESDFSNWLHFTEPHPTGGMDRLTLSLTQHPHN